MLNSPVLNYITVEVIHIVSSQPAGLGANNATWVKYANGDILTRGLCQWAYLGMLGSRVRRCNLLTQGVLGAGVRKELS